MSEIRPSLFLQQLMESAKQLDGKKEPPFTAERFIIAIINRFEWESNEGDVLEITKVQALINKAFTDRNAARDALVEYALKSRYVPFTDDLYMKKKIRELTESAISKGYEIIDASALLFCILCYPSEAIKPLIAGVTRQDLINCIKGLSGNPSQVGTVVMTVPAPTKTENSNDDDLLLEETPAMEIDEADPKEKLAGLVGQVKNIRTQLHNAIFGQNNAINTFVTGYFQANMMPKIKGIRQRPLATFLFAGPPGVGKTFLAEKAAEILDLPFKRFDMSEYSDKEAPLEFCGSDKVYKNGKAGNVTSFVAEHPKCILLFDEIEKAHLSVIHLFLQMLDAGRLRDNYTDVEVSFSDAIIIMTTNAGRPLYENVESGDFSTVSRKVIINAIQSDKKPGTSVPYFPGAICSRFASSNVIMFNHIGAHNLRSIAKSEIERQAANFKNSTNIEVEIDENVYTALLFAEGAAADARTVRGRAETFFNDEMYELLRLIGSGTSKTCIEDIEKVKMCIDLEGSPDEVSALFNSYEKQNVLIFADAERVELCKNNIDASVIGAQNFEQAENIIKSKNIDIVLIDIMCGAQNGKVDSLNIEDVDSPARDFFKLLGELNFSAPIYLIEDDASKLSEEERVSFTAQGVRDTLYLDKTGEALAKQFKVISANLYQQASINKLAKENKLVTFESAQSVSDNGKTAIIKLFDFDMSVAVDSEDAKDILSAVSKPNVRFSEVIGANDAKNELKYFVEYLRNPKKYLGTGVKAPKGVILYGPPGTGKTMLAKAMASEADVTFIAAEGNQFLTSYIGQGAEKVHQLFKTARKYAPSILFIDEIDAIAKERTGGINVSSNTEATLTAFLTEMDGFVSDPTRPVFVLAATNFDVTPGGPKSLDPALMRRFDRRIYIDLPNKAERIRFMKMKMEKNPALQITQAHLDNIALRSTGMSLAELDSAFELALRSAIRGGSTVVTDAILEEAFETFIGGEIKKWDDAGLERTARHEAGHALVSWLSGKTPSYLTIVARGTAGGYMHHVEDESKMIYTKDEFLSLIRTALAGRAAEIVCYGEKDGVSTGASNDLAKATAYAQSILCDLGMDEEFGLSVVNKAMASSDAIAAEVRSATNLILEQQMEETIKIIAENRDKLDSLVSELLSKNHLNGAQIEQAILNGTAQRAKME